MHGWIRWGLVGVVTWLGGVAPARAATWGSFDTTRIAYDLGALSGERHDGLRIQITDHGDDVAAPTGELTDAYLQGVDVFYTALLSDGTGPTAGLPGTLSLTEAQALSDWIATGGTLIVTVDSNGFDGPWATVYASWLDPIGVTGLSFQGGPGNSSPIVMHAVTQNVGSFEWDGIVRFDLPAEGFLLSDRGDGGNPVAAVFEPATGFAEGGRVLVLGDHNMLTDLFLDSADNLTLAQNVVEWAAGECGNSILESGEDCDDGNLDDGDACPSDCLEGGTTSTGGDTTSGGSDDTAGASSSTTTGADGSGDGGSTTFVTSGVPADGDGTDSSGGTTEGASEGGGDGGCGCRSAGGSGSGWGALWLAVVGFGLRRRARRRLVD